MNQGFLRPQGPGEREAECSYADRNSRRPCLATLVAPAMASVRFEIPESPEPLDDCSNDHVPAVAGLIGIIGALFYPLLSPPGSG